MTLKRITVYCGSRPGALPAYMQAAQELGRLIADGGKTLVYGGASIGLMGGVANAALAGGGEVIGVIPDALVSKEIAHGGLSDLRVVSDMHVRKRMMLDLGDAFIALPGGGGTMEEWFEVFTWAQIGLHQKPIGLLNVAGYYDKLLAFLDHIMDQGFAAESHRKLYVHATRAGDLLDLLEALAAPALGKPEQDRSGL
jgi:uncharacterized protein (TIGR00730 family)